MANFFIGREREVDELRDALESPFSELVAVIGRRRVGKTYLVETTYGDQIVFRASGLQNTGRRGQLKNFQKQLSLTTRSEVDAFDDWLDAFFRLSQYLETLDWTEKRVVFLDEIPWFATRRSDFLAGLSWFWNSWAVRQNIVVVICGSAASWMIQKVVNDRGGLHNRITRRIHLEPFNLRETERYLQARQLDFTRYQILQLYLCLGGIPHYLRSVRRGMSAAQNIERLCFGNTALLAGEFDRLYPALFSRSEKHVAVIRALSTKWHGLTHSELLKLVPFSSSGTLSRILGELEHSGFIRRFRSFGLKRVKQLIRLTDEYSLFYLKFIEGKAYEGDEIWQQLSQTPQFRTWSGYAFESICLKHVPQLKRALGISGIHSLSGSFYRKATDELPGAQIDLLIDRKDGVINLFEIKFSNDVLTVDQPLANRIRERKRIFRGATGTKKQLFNVLLTTFGYERRGVALDVVDVGLTMNALFD